MSRTFIFQDITMTIDPLQKYPQALVSDLLNLAGFLHNWITLKEPEQSMKNSLMANYPYYMGEIEGGKLLDDGTYTYPEDEPLYPALKYETSKEICYIYRHAIVACIDKETSNTWITRMD